MKDVKEVTFFRGDGIGPEISDSVFSVFSACKVPVHFDVYDVGQAEYDRHGKLIPSEESGDDAGRQGLPLHQCDTP